MSKSVGIVEHEQEETTADKSQNDVFERQDTVSSSSFDGGVIRYDKRERADRFVKIKSISDILTIICSGVALISDGYQNNIMTMLNNVFTKEYPKAYTSTVKTRVSNSLTVGTIIGQVVVGVCCDYMGRKWAIVSTTLLIILGSLMCTVAHGSTTAGMFWMMVVSRGITGFGVGGEYPSCSTAASESANESTKRRGGLFCLVTNLPLSLGGPFATIVFLIVYKCTGPTHLSTAWRVCLGIGIFWPMAIFYFRWRMATSVLYKKSAIRHNVPYLLSIKFYWKRLIGTCGCWFIYDFITFPNGIFSSTIISSVISDSSNLERVGEWTLLLGIIAIPGVFVGAYLVDVIGRKYTLMIGFSGYLVIGLIIGCAYEQLTKIVPLFIIFYGLFNSMGNLGPGDNMGLTSSECYATPIRGTFYGLSAAVGKAGAAIGNQCFTAIQDNLGKRWTFIIGAILGSVGVVIAFLCIPHLTDEDLMMEDVRYENYLRANGWTGTFGLGDDAQAGTLEDYGNQTTEKTTEITETGDEVEVKKSPIQETTK
ncbi:hypothetical protein PACTADRAFT_32677 [Pachysolen tannophilus NRRL Y-2460]|uniref:Major facilitator superfamily (MFS) profile domain-containing protein n=1 Tax=Pachysolen tannophilus NRRL Y-2460 TaxID=669874 RepID=A0A1E4TZM4_PACTA|nr:hypothetical protein PACTADRAFT_32677 [Pachysolen tannophilus NRRL Y-2460]